MGQGKKHTKGRQAFFTTIFFGGKTTLPKHRDSYPEGNTVYVTLSMKQNRGGSLKKNTFVLKKKGQKGHIQ